MSKRISKISRRRLTLAVASLVGLTFVSVAELTILMRGPSRTDLPVQTIEIPGHSNPAFAAVPASLRVMTFNIAHGRSIGLHQALLSKSAIQSNLSSIAEMLEREHPDVVALQECDGPSLWSGNIPQASFLAESSSFPYFMQGEHVKGLRLSYGTALLSRFRMVGAMSFTFQPSPPTFSKGFVIATVRVPGTDTAVDIVSAHLDFSSEKVRHRQISRMIAFLSGRTNPCVIAGDFNDELAEGGPLRTMITELGLVAYEPDGEGLVSFPSQDQRLDWILISAEMRFVSYKVIGDVLSDHLAVMGEVSLKQK